MRKRIFAGLLALVMMLSVVPATEVSAATTSGPNVEKTVAKIGDAPYSSLAAALEAAAVIDGDVTINLLDDVTWETGAEHGSTPLIPADSAVDKVTIVGGEGVTLTATGKGVGPIRAANGAQLVFKNITVVDESVSYAEDAWELTYLEMAGNLKFEDCTFVNAISFGDGNDNMTAADNSAEFVNCKFNSNKDNEYGLWISYGTVVIDNCLFEGPRGLKLHEAYGSEVISVTVENTVFTDITKKPGIALGTLNANTTVTLENNKFIACQPGDQGLYIYETDTEVTKFTLNLINNLVCQNHVVETVAEVSSTCTATGTKAHYKCETCGNLFLNAEDTTPVAEADLVIEKKAHTPAAELVNVKAATCTAEGYTGDEVCSVCGTTTKEGTVIAALGHNFDEKTGTCKNNCGVQIIVDAGEVDVLVQPEETEHKVSEDIPEDVKEVATEIASSVTTSTESLTKAVEETAETYAKDEELIAQAKEALNVEKDEDVQIIVKPHLEIEIKMVETTEAPEAEKPLVVVEINLVYDVVAKKADGSAEEHLKEVKVTDPGKAIEISFDVSEEIAEMLQEMIVAGKKIYIKHPKKNGDVYFHEAKLAGKKVKFTNNAGFSEFTLMYGDEVPANVIKSTSGSVQSTIAMYAETGKYIEVSSVSESIIEEGKEELRALIGDSYGKYRLALAADLHADLKGSTKIKILVDDVTAADAVIILRKGADGWEAISNKAGDGYVFGKFSSLSPVLVFVDEDGELEAAQTGNITTTTPAGTTAPAATGDSSMTALWIGVLAIAAVAVVCTFVYNKKRRA